MQTSENAVNQKFNLGKFVFHEVRE